MASQSPSSDPDDAGSGSTGSGDTGHGDTGSKATGRGDGAQASFAATMRPPHPPVGWGTLATLLVSFFAVGVTVSVALVERGTPNGIIVAAAAFVFSATSELAYIAVRDAGGSEVTAVLSGWLVASRFGLLATALGARFGGSIPQRVVAAICSFDPNVAVAVEQRTAHDVRRAFWWATAAMMGGWAIGTIVGIVVGNVIGDVAAWGIDAVFPAALLAIIGPTLRRRPGLLAAVLGAGICLLLTPFTPGGVPILASVLGAFGAVAITNRLPTNEVSADQTRADQTRPNQADRESHSSDGGEPG